MSDDDSLQFEWHRWYNQFMCRVKLRPEYRGNPLKQGLERLNGQVVRMQVLFKGGEDDKYPAEFALEPADDKLRRDWFDGGRGVVWISSGDVELLEVVPWEAGTSVSKPD